MEQSWCAIAAQLGQAAGKSVLDAALRLVLCQLGLIVGGIDPGPGDTGIAPLTGH